MAIVLGLCSGFQVLGFSRDYENYLLYFDFVTESSWTEVFAYRFEPGFAVLASALTAAHLSGPAVYSVIAGACIFIKYFALRSAKKFWPVIGIFTFYYLLRYLALFEMTVLRATVAFSIGFYVFYTRRPHEYRAKQMLLLLLAIMMHYSAVVFTVAYAIGPTSRKRVVVTASFVFLAIVATKTIALAVLPNYVTVFSSYNEFDRATLLPIPFAVDLMFFLFALLAWDKNDPLMKTSVLTMGVAAAFHFALLDYSVLAARFRELLSVFCLLYVTRAVSVAPNGMKYATLAYAAFSAALYGYGTYFHDPLLIND